MTKGEISKKLFLEGNNCSVSVALAFADEMGLPAEQVKKLIIGFGGGFGRQRLVCGAVSGMTMALSYVLSDGENRASIYPVIQEASALFKAELGTLICAELLAGVQTTEGVIPEDRTEGYYKKRPCAEICQIAGDITQKIIDKYKAK